MTETQIPQSTPESPHLRDARYELVDLTTGSLIDTYANERDAAMAIRRVRSDEELLTLALGLDDPTGQTDGTLIARGADLANWAWSKNL